ncbi:MULTISPECIES: bifunctional 4-hydroxy-2-oxoglutarate aldolase/2-dehydro-3-deoxy-phosphogluconate aldolase [unclassified Synechocystis]|uniref:bifunctional 4-hydroxy-2-oxoglutarate aldolase/2-dehydro-3-deoxy-phosphogluconate aldolase n=1 Tax=unclassified Synechocystis TaxID=2640012 RepID=UPI00210116ED|nr:MULTISPECIES: bifunctional 4-hydroxy-2-oxoglutarate aldolase/2-dehydro-3-deoxy-phosphogluconate aldolase [unclassified Synechocystis]
MSALRSPWLEILHKHRAIAVIRTDCLDLSVQLARVAIEAGMGLVEITWNSDQPEKTIEQLRHQFPHCAIGTGTVLSRRDLLQAVASGAQFCFTPHNDSELITTAVAHALPIIPGAFSPTEIVQAWQRGAAAVKVFPIQALGGVDYIKALQGPLGQIPLIPTGGVTLDNAQAFLRAGAIAVGLSGQLFPRHLVQAQAWPEIGHRIHTLVEQLQNSPN